MKFKPHSHPNAAHPMRQARKVLHEKHQAMLGIAENLVRMEISHAKGSSANNELAKVLETIEAGRKKALQLP